MFTDLANLMQAGKVDRCASFTPERWQLCEPSVKCLNFYAILFTITHAHCCVWQESIENDDIQFASVKTALNYEREYSKWHS